MVKIPEVELNFVDRLVGYLSPSAGLGRVRARLALGAVAGGYKGARRDRRPTQGWTVGQESADSALQGDVGMLRDRSRDLIRNSPIGRGAVNGLVTSVIGPGLVVCPLIDREFLGLDEAAADDFEDAAEREFNLWAESAEADVARTNTFAEMQDIAFRATLADGDVFVFKRYIERAGSPFGYKLQLIEADRVCNPNWTRDTPAITGGVEVDQFGAPVAYHVLDRHPGDAYKGAAAAKWTRITAFGERSGRRNVEHLFRRLRVGQTRGEPYLAPVIEGLKQLGDYTDAELSAAVISSFFTVFVKSESGEGLAPAEPTSETGGRADDKDYKMGPASILDLGKGEDVTFANPQRPNANFDPFFVAIVRQIGVALEQPFETLIKHFTASYSASRAALLEAWKFYSGRRAWIAKRFCQVAYEDVIAEAVARGRLWAPGFFGSDLVRKAYLGAEWAGPGMPSLDPKKENDADAEAEDRGWTTAQENTTKRSGGNFKRKQARRAREQRLRAELGLGVASSAAGSPAALPSPEPDPADNVDAPDFERE